MNNFIFMLVKTSLVQNSS